MRIALIADLHGNRQATEALEEDLKLTCPDELWCLGDLVGKGPANVFTFDWAVSHCSLILGGNWDYGIGAKQFPNDAFYWDSLGKERLEYLARLPLEKTVVYSGRRIRLFHGRPLMDKLIGIRNDQEEIETLFVDEKGLRWDVLLYADTHRQAFRTLNPGLFINIGSIGNAIGEVHGCYALMEGEPGGAKTSFEIRFRQFEYDRESAALEALASGMPNAELFVNEIRTGFYSRGKAAAKSKGEF